MSRRWARIRSLFSRWSFASNGSVDGKRALVIESLEPRVALHAGEFHPVEPVEQTPHALTETGGLPNDQEDQLLGSLLPASRRVIVQFERPTRTERRYRDDDASLHKMLDYDTASDLLVTFREFHRNGDLRRVFHYDPETGATLQKNYFTDQGRIRHRTFFDSQTERPLLWIQYYADGKIRKVYRYDSKSGVRTQANRYAEPGHLWTREFTHPTTRQSRAYEQFNADGTRVKFYHHDPNFPVPKREPYDLLPNLFFSYSPATRHDPDAVHSDEPLKRDEHEKLFELVPDRDATLVIARDTLLSKIRNRLQNGERIVVAGGATLVVDTVLDTRLDWIRVDGRLVFRPDVNTQLRVIDLVVSVSGTLAIGSPTHRIDADHVARIVFSDRGRRDPERDPLDLGGGLLSHGEVQIFGAEYDSHAIPIDPIVRGTDTLHFRSRPVGWKAGDELIFATTATPLANQDEVRRITRLSPDGRDVTLSRPLQFDHTTPAPARLPVGNLTRNVSLESENRQEIPRRAHVMFMHNHSRPTVVDSARFYGLGRTDARTVHTVPVLDAQGHLVQGTDANTIGRYAVHFHMRTGASVQNQPHVLRNSAVVDSPKFGVVNHGASLNADQNVTYSIAGSHFFAENGSEIGTFRGNLAIRSPGSGEDPKDDVRLTGQINVDNVFDHGHEGNGFWLQSGGVEVTDNYAFGHKHAAYVVFTLPIYEDGTEIKFQVENLNDPRLAPDLALIDVSQVPLFAARNVGATSGNGMFIRYLHRHQQRSASGAEALSVIRDSIFWGMREDGINTRYTNQVSFEKVRVLNETPELVGRGLRYGFRTFRDQSGLRFEDIVAKGFTVGLGVPEGTNNHIANSLLQNVTNIQRSFDDGLTHEIHIHNVVLAPLLPADPTHFFDSTDTVENRALDTSDVIALLAASRADGRYESGLYARWDDGDWTGDGLFDSRDIVAFLGAIQKAPVR